MPHAEVTLPGVSSSVPTARHFVENVLAALLAAFGEADAEQADAPRALAA